MVTFWLLIDTIAMIGSPASRGAAPSVVCSGRAWRGAASAGGAAGSAVRAAVAAERHNRGRCPSPDYLGGLGRRASICHAMSRLSGRNRVETNTENGWMVPVLRPVVNQHFHVIGLLPADYLCG